MINQRLKISIVDDDQSVRKALFRLCGSAGFGVETFASGREFLDSLEKQRPDCVILDLHLPGLSGSDVQQQLAQQSPKLPIIMITGRDDPGVGDRLRIAGAAAYLNKPLEERGLLEAVAAATGAGIAMEEPGQSNQETMRSMVVDKPLPE